MSLYDRLPRIYQDKDAEQLPPYQLKRYLEIFETILGRIHENIEDLYHDIFIETCDEWVIPYIGDLLGVTHLKTDSWHNRADVADTIALRRRKGTLSAIELLTYDLTGWGVHCSELRDRLLFNQNINLYNDFKKMYKLSILSGNEYGEPERNRTADIRKRGVLSLQRTPFDSLHYTADVKPLVIDNLRYNIPNLAIYLWRLEPYQIPLSKAVRAEGYPKAQAPVDGIDDVAEHISAFYVQPLGRSKVLFNKCSDIICVTCGFENSIDDDICQNCGAPMPRKNFKADYVRVSDLDEAPGPILRTRLNEISSVGRPVKYVTLSNFEDYDQLAVFAHTKIPNVGLRIFLVGGDFKEEEWPSSIPEKKWRIRGSKLEAWEHSLSSPLRNREIAIDPQLGRILIGLDDRLDTEDDILYLTYTYGSIKDVGANPRERNVPNEWSDAKKIEVEGGGTSLNDKLRNGLKDEKKVIIEIRDSLIYDVQSHIESDGLIYIRTRDGCRPIIRLTRPLQIYPAKRFSEFGSADEYHEYIYSLKVTFEGLFITGSDERDYPLFDRIAINELTFNQCTLDPTRYLGDAIEERKPRIAMHLRRHYGFPEGSDEILNFPEIPRISFYNSITGSLFVDRFYQLAFVNSIIDASTSVKEQESARFAIRDDGGADWGPPTKMKGTTVFGKSKVERISGSSNIFGHRLQVQRTLEGCMKQSYIVAKRGEIPQIEGCIVVGPGAKDRPTLSFESEVFGDPGFAQLTHSTDYRIREGGLNFNAMGATGFLRESDKWRNLQIRLREFMPVGIRSVFMTVT